jgi:hypothetical protein
MEIQSGNLMYNKVTHIISIGCGVIFSLYSFIYLYLLQGNVVEALHFSLAHGRTSYSIFWGAVMLTLVLVLIRYGLNALLKLHGPWVAFSYFPSALLLGVLTDVDRSAFHGGGFAYYWAWLLPLLLVVYVIVALFIRDVFKNKVWSNVLDVYNINVGMLILGCLIPIFIGNTDNSFHHELAVEHHIRHGDFSAALKVGKKSFHTTKTLNILRANAMACCDSLGDKLFAYPQPYKSDGLMFTVTTPKQELLRFNADTLYRMIGATHYVGEKNVDYLKRISKIDSIGNMGKQYYLSALLLDKQLNEFRVALDSVYPKGARIPKYYKQALLLYQQKDTVNQRIINDSAMISLFNLFFEKRQKSYPSKAVEKNLMRKEFGKTYWWYYYYQ